MSGLESIIATGSDVLAGPIDYAIGADQASYVTSRESQTFFANQNLVNPQSVRTLKFQIGGNVLEVVDALKLLGLTIRSDLKWRSSIKNMIVKAGRVSI